MGKKSNRLESTIAMSIVFFVMSILVFVYYRYSGHHYQTSNFYAEFDSISGLNVGCPVKINGVVVGKVNSFHIDPKKNFVVIVSFSIDRTLSLPEDTRAAIAAESLFGSTILTLSPGTSEELLAEDAIILDTQSPLQMPELLQKFLFNSADSADRDGSSDKLDKEDKDDGAIDDGKKASVLEKPMSHSITSAGEYSDVRDVLLHRENEC